MYSTKKDKSSFSNFLLFVNISKWLGTPSTIFGLCLINKSGNSFTSNFGMQYVLCVFDARRLIKDLLGEDILDKMEFKPEIDAKLLSQRKEE